MRTVALLLFVASALTAQTHAAHRAPVSHANADRLGLTCTQILQMSSAEWVAKFTVEKGSQPAETVRALDAYGKCYDARTDQIAARLKRTGKGPLMGARANFKSVEQALKAFAAKALAESDPPADAVKSARAALYEKEFRYEFYESYEPQPPAPPAKAARTPKEAALPSNSPTSSAPHNNKDNGASNASSSQATGAPSQTVPDANPKDREKEVDPLTAAKNHFGALLGALPDDRMHDLHKAFGEILGPNSATSRMQLLIYRYAIFLLEAPGDKPFSPAPF
ncbi:MAG TPA: hypothetical protein VJN69_15285 [Candidatus Acidoferrales bacterium]|nr:hypothetical protein [Candidatus Acidoferrales bacterium]